MQVVAVKAHRHIGVFETFKKGSQVHDIKACQQYAGWASATIDGQFCYVYQDFVQNGRLICDYNPTELDVMVGDVLKLIAIYQDWALVKKGEQVGWLPCVCVKTLEKSH